MQRVAALEQHCADKAAMLASQGMLGQQWLSMGLERVTAQ